VPTSAIEENPVNNSELGRAMFGHADRLDVVGWAKCLADDVSFRFGNADVVHGRQAVQDAVGPFFDSIAGLRHDVLRDWSVDDTVIQELSVTYTRHDASTLTVPAVNILRFHDGGVADYRMFVDIGALYG
jgi:ketosteroid isomerase-like protein